MNKMNKILTLLAACLLSTTFLFSQTPDQRWAVGLHLNKTNYQGDLGNHILDMDFGRSKLGFAISGDYYVNKFLDLRAKISYTTMEIYDERGTYSANSNNGYAKNIGTPYGNWGFDGKLLANTINAVVKLNNGIILPENTQLKPFVVLGIGETRFKTDVTLNRKFTKKYHNLDIYTGLGAKYNLNEQFNLIFEVGFHNNFNDDLDGITETTASGWADAGSSNDNLLQFSLGATYNLGKKKDADNDGVSDKKDQCPNTPQGVEVDDKGCPLDRDEDGVADYMDECPDVKGTVKGCPDNDQDRIANKNDDCPDEKGPASTKGCPDTDRDGVIDKNDKCPNRRGPSANNGCPYPDTDGDGVLDKDDRCPNEIGTRANNGCPEIQEIKKVVYFDSDKAYIKRQYYSVLDDVVSTMMSNGAYMLSIEGHTDNLFSNSYNLNLSKKRAEAVKKYVVKKGISKNRVSTSYFGEKNPVESNTSRAGRKKNRRAELRLIIK